MITRPARIRFSLLALSAALLCGCVSPARQFVGKRPERWDAELSTSAGVSGRFVVEIHDRGQGFTEFVVRRGERGMPLLRYETVHVSQPSPAELAFLYDAVVKTLRDFHFERDTLPDFMDGGRATVTLSIGTRSLAAGFGPYRDTAELPSSVQRIMKFAESKMAKHPKRQIQ